MKTQSVDVDFDPQELWEKGWRFGPLVMKTKSNGEVIWETEMIPPPKEEEEE